MSLPPKVSVVLPVRYVNFDWLRKSIESVLSQDYPNKELIVVNDEATQPIEELVASYAIPKYIKNDRNRKLPYSLNRGFERADGAYHTWTSADNFMRPGMLTRLAAALDAQPEAGLVFGRSVTIDEQGTEQDESLAFQHRISRLTHIDATAIPIPRRYTYFSTLGACFLYRAEVWRELGGYDERLHGAEDYDFWIRAARRFAIIRLPVETPPLYAYRVHGESMSSIVAGCFTSMRVNILGREIRADPFDAWRYYAWSFYARRWLGARARACFARRSVAS